MEIVSHRAVWSLFFCLVALGIAKQLKSTYALLKNPKVFFRLLLAAGLISVNWLVYIWGVNNEHVVETALGYYINPLIIIAFGVITLREKMRKLQWVAVSFGALGVIVLTIDYGRLPWIALALAFSWGSYVLVKKQLNLGALEGLAIEVLERERREWRLERIRLMQCIHHQQIELGQRAAASHERATEIAKVILLLLLLLLLSLSLLSLPYFKNLLPLNLCFL
jgi:RarD protein